MLVIQNKSILKGFSLVEVMFSVAIVSIIVTYATYAYRDFTDKAKYQEAARLAYEIRQGIDVHVANKRNLPPAMHKNYRGLAYVEKVETQQDGANQYRINVFFKRSAFTGRVSQQVYTLYGSYVDGQIGWHDCGVSCVKNDVDIPPAQPVPPGTNRGITGSRGSVPTPGVLGVVMMEPYGKTTVVIKFKGGNQYDGALRANIRAIKKRRKTSKTGPKKYYGVETYELSGGGYPYDAITAELQQYDKTKKQWVRVWSKNVPSAPRGEDKKYTYFQTIETKLKLDVNTPGWAVIPTFPGDDWDGNGNPNPDGGEDLPDPPSPIYDWKTTHINVKNIGGYQSQTDFVIYYRNGKKDEHSGKQPIGGWFALKVPGWPARENPVEKITLQFSRFRLFGGWTGFGKTTITPAGYTKDKYECYSMKGTSVKPKRKKESDCSDRRWSD